MNSEKKRQKKLQKQGQVREGSNKREQGMSEREVAVVKKEIPSD